MMKKKKDPGRFGETVRNVCVTVNEKGKRGNDETVKKKKKKPSPFLYVHTKHEGVVVV